MGYLYNLQLCARALWERTAELQDSLGSRGQLEGLSTVLGQAEDSRAGPGIDWHGILDC